MPFGWSYRGKVRNVAELKGQDLYSYDSRLKGWGPGAISIAGPGREKPHGVGLECDVRSCLV